MEVPAVAGEHFGYESEFLGPEFSRRGRGNVGGCLLQRPDAVIPEPVAFGEFEEEGEEEG